MKKIKIKKEKKRKEMNKKQKKTSERNQAGINSLTATPPKGEDSIRCVGGVNKHEMELDE